ncbi:MAG: hypothetical protein IPN84_08210 [Sphingomonadales bacterium]|nr:hypothetical protein [Sphingomonadales bacterium]
MGIDLSSLSPILTGLAGGAVATALARWGARGVTDKRGWKCIRPSALHWTGVILGTALTSLFVYVWLFVGSSRADGVQQMQILGWLIVAFTLAIMMCAAQIWRLLRQDVQWRGSIITFRRGGVRVQDDLKTLVDCRQRWTQEFELVFASGHRLRIDPNAKGAEQLAEAILRHGPEGLPDPD